MAGADGVEKLEDVIVRSAEQVAGQIRAAKDAISHRHLRPGPGDRAHAGDDPVRRPRAADRRARPRQDQAGRDAGHHARARRQAHPVHARPDAVRHSRRRSAGRERRRQALVPLHHGTGLRAAADGRRNQPRQPAHPVGAAAGDAGAARHGRRRAPRSADAVPRAGDAEPAGAGRHLSAARSAARPLPDGDRRRLSRSRRRAAHPVRDHRRRGDARQGGDERRDPDRGAAAGAPAAGRRQRRRSDPVAGALRASGRRKAAKPAS